MLTVLDVTHGHQHRRLQLDQRVAALARRLHGQACRVSGVRVQVHLEEAVGQLVEHAGGGLVVTVHLQSFDVPVESCIVVSVRENGRER